MRGRSEKRSSYDGPAYEPNQASNRSSRPETDICRSWPSVPRGAPQCLHWIGVKDGALSEQSKMMPMASQTLQTI
jgi:hypothetical protein